MKKIQNFNKKGLSTKEVQKRIKKFGYNEIKTKKEYRGLKIFLSQFTSLLIIILIFAGAISIFLNEIIDGIAILSIVILNSIIGFIQEYKADNAIKALKKMVVPTTIVIRDEKEQKISIKELVPDDIVILAEGDKIPADLIILEAFSLKVDESMLTGESVPVNKKIGDGKTGKLYKGTLITTGRAKAIVKSTGIHTEFGKIIDLVSKDENTQSPLSVQLNDIGKKAGLIILGLIIILFILGKLRGISTIEMLMTSVALGVSAIPEGLPIIVTLTLAMGVQILSRKKAIVRKMQSIETLGATTVICSDKTGTLTLNQMTVKKINTSFTEKDIPGEGYKLKEKISLNSDEEKKLLDICENCNSAFVDNNILGDPTEIALKILSRKADYVNRYKEIDENVFTSERKMMSSLHTVGSKKEIFAKGAHEEILKKCTKIMENGKIRIINKKDKEKIINFAEKYSKKALRVLAFAYKEYNNKFDEEGLIYVGLIGMIDPPRKSVKSSIAIAQKAGIKVKIITGDNPITASAVGKKIGLNINNVILGEQIDKMTNKELKKAIYKTEIFARTKPEHKYRIVDLLQKNNEVVAVTGDGVNDAPAIKHGDVGIAMGIQGTEATKEVADIILKDDNFTTIVNTIEEGRRIYHNILAFIKYMLAANYDSILTVGIITIMGKALPILPLQILWINIATDSLPALALGKSKASTGIMNEKPHPKKENIFKKFFIFIFTATVLQVIVNLAIYFYGLEQDSINAINSYDLSTASHARTLVFTEIVLFELFFAFVCKEEKSINLKTFLSNKMLIWSVLIAFCLQLFMIYTPFMQKIFKTVSLTFSEWIVLIILALTAFLVPPIANSVKKLINKFKI